MRRISIVLVLLTLLLSACASDRRDTALTTTLNAYANAMRWGDFQSALQFVDPEVLKAHPPTDLEMARYAQFKVSGYDDGAGPKPTSETEVQQLVQVSLVNINTQAERTVLDRQTWHYDPVKNRWWLMSGLPNIQQ